MSGETSDVDELEAVDGIPGALAQPVTGFLTLQALYDQVKSGAIDLDPDFQRAVVWKEAKQSGLIRSLFQNFPIPPLYFSLNIREGLSIRVSLDGKQRLSSIVRFMDGEIPFIMPETDAKYYYREVPGKKNRTLLSEALRARFAEKSLTCVQFNHLSDFQERDIFQRVQLGMALTEGERLSAMAGPWPTLVHTVCNKYVECEDGLIHYLTTMSERGKAFQTVAIAITSIDALPNKQYHSYAQLNKVLKKEHPPKQWLQRDVEDVFAKFLSLASGDKTKFPFAPGTPRVSPVEFVFIVILIWRLRKDCTDDQLAHEVQKLRSAVRKRHDDIRANGRVVATMWELVETAANVHDAKLKKRGVKDNEDYDDVEERKAPKPSKRLKVAKRTSVA